MRKDDNDREERGGGGYERLTDSPRMEDGRRRGLLSGMVDGFARIPIGFRLFLALAALMSVLAMLVE